MIIRKVAAEDAEAIDLVHRLAFGREVEAKLVRDLIEEGAAAVSLAAIENEQIIGHILFSEAPIFAGERTIRAAILGPLGVLPDFQNQGVGAALTEAGLAACREAGFAAVFLVGHPTYYPRFGFSAELAKRLHAPWRGKAFMALELVPGTLAVDSATVSIPRSFEGL